MHYLRLATLLALFTPFAWASAQDRIKCNDAGTQAELNVCAAAEFTQADKELNEVYGALLKKQSADRSFIKKLRAAQRAWVVFRDAEMEATFACEPAEQPCWGSMQSMCMSSYKAKLTRERTARLRQMLDKGGAGDVCQ